MWILMFPFISLHFFISFLVFFILMVWFVENEKSAASFISLVIFVVFCVFFTDIAKLDIWERILWWHWLSFPMVYIVTGFIWSRLKFHFYVRDIEHKLNLLKEEWKNKCKKDRKEISKYDWENYVNSKRSMFKGVNTSEVNDFEKNSPRILRWALYWPWSLVGTLLNDPIRKAFEYIYHHYLVGTFRRSFQAHVVSNYDLSTEELSQIQSEKFQESKNKNMNREDV